MMTGTSVRGWPVRQSVESIRPVVWYLSGGPSPMKTVVTLSVPPCLKTRSYWEVACTSKYASRSVERMAVLWRDQRSDGNPVNPSPARRSAPTVKSQLPVARWQSSNLRCGYSS